MLFRHIQIVDYGFNDLEVAISISMTENGLERTKKIQRQSISRLIQDKKTAQTLKALSDSLPANESNFSRRLRAMGQNHKEGKWLPHELTEIATSNHFNIAVSLTACQANNYVAYCNWR